MAEGFTKGPWTLLPQNGAGPMIVHEFETGKQMNPTGYRLVAHMLQRGNSLKEDRANAHLIAAAPELYEALKLVTDWVLDHGHVPQSVLTDARAALAKARGEDAP